jgi:hypothetical protein
MNGQTVSTFLELVAVGWLSYPALASLPGLHSVVDEVDPTRPIISVDPPPVKRSALLGVGLFRVLEAA